MWWFWEKGERRIHGVLDRCHSEGVEKFETVEDSEPARQPLFA